MLEWHLRRSPWDAPMFFPMEERFPGMQWDVPSKWPPPTSPPAQPAMTGGGGRFGGAGLSSYWPLITGRFEESPENAGNIPFDLIDELVDALMRQRVDAQGSAAVMPATPPPMASIGAQPAPRVAVKPLGLPASYPGNVPPSDVIPPDVGWPPPPIPSASPVPVATPQRPPLVPAHRMPLGTSGPMPLLPSHAPSTEAGISAAPLPIPLVPSHRTTAPQLPSDVIPSGVGLPVPEPMPLAEYLAGRVPAEVPTWEFPGGRISVPGGDEGLARLRKQAQEWLERQQSKSEKSASKGLNLSIPPAGTRFSPTVIEESWGRESEASELRKARERAEIASRMAEAEASQLGALAKIADVQRKQDAMQTQGAINNAIIQRAETLATEGVSIDDAVAELQPLYEQAYSMGVKPQFSTPTALYSYILRRRGIQPGDRGVPPPPTAHDVARSREELLKRAGLTR